jgi:hypothetical protein
VPVQLARDHLLPDDVADLVQATQPHRAAITERTVRDLIAARPVSSGHPTTLPAVTPNQQVRATNIPDSSRRASGFLRDVQNTGYLSNVRAIFLSTAGYYTEIRSDEYHSA